MPFIDKMSWVESQETSREVKRPGKGQEGMTLQLITGTLYPCTAKTLDMIQQLDIVRGLQLRDDDVISMGMPRSGNHWCFEIVSMICRQSTEYDKDVFQDHLIEYEGPNVQEKMEHFSVPRNLTTHIRVTKLPSQVLEKGNKIIYMLRNPKDVWVSEFFLMSQFLDTRIRYTGTWAEYFECQMEDLAIPGSWFDHVLSLEAFMAQYPDHPVYIFLFEKFKEKPIDGVREMCHFLGKPDNLAEDIAKATEFEIMKTALMKGKMAALDGTQYIKGQNNVIRKGSVGSWKDWFTVAQNEAFDKKFKKKMADSKLAKIVEPYIGL